MTGAWFLAIRPKTLPAAAAPVVIGSVMAVHDNGFDGLAALAALAGALLIQVGTNLANDYFDFRKGADTPERLGPVRVTQAGLIAPEAVRLGFITAFSLAVLSSLYLVVRGGWPVIVIGAASILAGIFYTAGRLAYGYKGLGEIFVLVFFGPVAVAGTYYVQALRFDMAAVIAGVIPGLFSTAILAVNNLRDIDQDRKAGKRTLAVRWGRAFGRAEFAGCIAGACLAHLLLCVYTGGHWASLVAALTCLFMVPTVRILATREDGPSLNAALAYTGRILLVYTLVFAVTWNL